MSARDTVVTPVAASASNGNNVHVREVLGVVKATLGTIQQQRSAIEAQTASISAFGPSMAQAAEEIEVLRRQIQQQDEKQASQMDELREKVRVKFKEQAEKEHKTMIQEEIGKELLEQVRKEVKVQIKEFLPVSLEDQIKETRDYTTRIQNAHKNSEARRANGLLNDNNLRDKLQVMLTPKGTPGALYPRDLNTLFEYDDEKLKALLKQYELTPQDKRGENVNRFLAHIGICFTVVFPE